MNNQITSVGVQALVLALKENKTLMKLEFHATGELNNAVFGIARNTSTNVDLNNKKLTMFVLKPLLSLCQATYR